MRPDGEAPGAFGVPSDRGDDDGAAPSGALTALVDALEVLRSRLTAVRLPLDAPGAPAARADMRAALDQLDDYLLPRLRAQGAPLLVVVGGSTGAGKSTLVNSLLGEQVSAPGVLRPTTRAPLLVHHPLDAAWFTADRVLPGLARARAARKVGLADGPMPPGPARAAAEPGTEPGSAPGSAAEPGTGPGSASGPASGPAALRELRLVASETLPRGLALLDAPDVDSVDTANRELAAQLLAAADLWLFVTTAARYADAVPWELLRTAAARRAQVALVVDRVDPGAEAVAGDLRRMMDENGLGDAPLFAVPEVPLVEGLLDEAAIAPVATWLTGLGADEAGRRAVATATRDGVVDDLVRRAGELAGAADEQVAADARLRAVVADAYDVAVARVQAVTSDGEMLRGEVLARWQELVGTSELFRQIETGVGRLRDRVSRFLRGRPTEAPRVEQAIATGLQAVLLDAADGAAERTYAAWRADPAGGSLVAGLDLSRSSPLLRRRVDEAVRSWQHDVLELVREQGASRRGAARYLSLGVNALGVALMLVTFSATGGVTGVEVGIAGGTALVAQRLLEAVFGDEAVRRLTTTARAALDARVRALLDDEAGRFTTQLDALGTAQAGGDPLRAAAREVEHVARTERSGRPRRPAPAQGGWTSLRGAASAAGRASRLGGRDRAGRDGGSPRFWRRLFGRGRGSGGSEGTGGSGGGS
jgi:hypothetical protein